MKNILRNIILVVSLLGVSSYILISEDLKNLGKTASVNDKENIGDSLEEVEYLEKLWLDNYESYLTEYAVGNTNRATLVKNYKNFYHLLSSLKMNNSYKTKLEELLLLEIKYIEKESNIGYVDIINYSEKLGIEKAKFRDSIYAKMLRPV